MALQAAHMFSFFFFVPDDCRTASIDSIVVDSVVCLIFVFPIHCAQNAIEAYELIVR